MLTQITKALYLGSMLSGKPQQLLSDARGAARGLIVLAGCTMLAATLLLPAAGCAGVGLWIVIQHNFGPVWAAFATCAGFVVLAGIVMLVGLLSKRRRRRHNKIGQVKRKWSVTREGHGAGGGHTWERALPALLSVSTQIKARSGDAARSYFSKNKATVLFGAVVMGLLLGQDAGFLRRRIRRP